MYNHILLKALFEQICQLQFFCLNQVKHISKFLNASLSDKILSISAFNNPRRSQRSGDGRQFSSYQEFFGVRRTLVGHQGAVGEDLSQPRVIGDHHPVMLPDDVCDGGQTRVSGHLSPSPLSSELLGAGWLMLSVSRCQSVPGRSHVTSASPGAPPV